jgi:hypothetical protein
MLWNKLGFGINFPDKKILLIKRSRMPLYVARFLRQFIDITTVDICNLGNDRKAIPSMWQY